MRCALTIAGSDPSGGAGIQADLRTFSAFQVKGLSVITALTAQNDITFNDFFPIPPEFIKKQWEAVLHRYDINAVKIGMLAKKEIITTVAGLLSFLNVKNMVLDPVLMSSSGFPLLEENGLSVLKELFPYALVVTPNIYEASVISDTNIKTEDEMKEAAVKIKGMGSDFVLIKGGHLKEKAMDILYDGKVFKSYESKKIAGSFHGTGCVFSAGLAASLANGNTIYRAVKEAKEFVTECIKSQKHDCHSTHSPEISS